MPKLSLLSPQGFFPELTAIPPSGFDLLRWKEDISRFPSYDRSNRSGSAIDLTDTQPKTASRHRAASNRRGSISQLYFIVLSS